MNPVHQKVAECAKAAAVATIKAMSIDGKVNLPSMIAGCARYGGSCQLRAQGVDLSHVPPGQPVLHAGAEAGTATLVNFCVSILGSLGAQIPQSPPAPFDELRTKITHDYAVTHARLQPVLAPLQAQSALTDEQMAKAMASATAILVHQFAKYMEPGAGFGFALYGFTEGLRTAPG